MFCTVPTSLLASITDAMATESEPAVPDALATTGSPAPAVLGCRGNAPALGSAPGREASSVKNARKIPGETNPEPSTGSSAAVKPSNWASERADSRTASCSMALISTLLRPGWRSRRANAMPLTARLSASVPPEVKMISPGRAPKTAATRSRASSNARAARWPRS